MKIIVGCGISRYYGYMQAICKHAVTRKLFFGQLEVQNSGIVFTGFRKTFLLRNDTVTIHIDRSEITKIETWSPNFVRVTTPAGLWRFTLGKSDIDPVFGRLRPGSGRNNFGAEIRYENMATKRGEWLRKDFIERVKTALSLEPVSPGGILGWSGNRKIVVKYTVFFVIVLCIFVIAVTLPAVIPYGIGRQ